MSGIGTETAIFFYACLSGMTVYFSYRILSSIREIIPHSNLAVGVEDFIFWLGMSGYLFYQMYVTTYGSIRWFFVLGVVCGALLAYCAAALLKKIYLKAKKKLEEVRETR